MKKGGGLFFFRVIDKDYETQYNNKVICALLYIRFMEEAGINLLSEIGFPIIKSISLKKYFPEIVSIPKKTR
jgi:hypothetical protein